MFLAPWDAVLVQTGDSVNLRFHLGWTDTGWVEPSSLARLHEATRPPVVVQLELGSLQAAFFAAFVR